MKILIATGIYPPDIGGPATYSKNLYKALSGAGNQVKVRSFGIEKRLPTGVRHAFYAFKVLSVMFWSNFIICMDTFSVALPIVFLNKFFRKKIILRTGGDFLWEHYVERTGDMVLLRDFYSRSLTKLNSKEKIIFKIIKWIINNVDVLVFSTEWQRDIFAKPYGIDLSKTKIIENYYDKNQVKTSYKTKLFLAGTRKLKWKNLDLLRKAFDLAKKTNNEIHLDLNNYKHDEYLEKIKDSYATILVSLGDISPNMILESVKYGKPFVLTRENGLSNRVKDFGLLTDPKDESDIAKKILELSNDDVYNEFKERIANNQFCHTWGEIAGEFLQLIKEK